MEMSDIVDRLAAVDHELGEVEALRAIAQKDGDFAKLKLLEEEIGRLARVRDELREQLRRRQQR